MRLAGNVRRFLLIESNADGKHTLASPHVAQAGVVISGAIAETVAFSVESDERNEKDRRVDCRLGCGWLGHAELSALEGRAGHPFPECEPVAFAHTGQRDAKTVGMKSCQKRQGIKLSTKRMITTYGAGEAERLNERNAFPRDGLRSGSS